MGYYKNTMYYGQNRGWHYAGCTCEECRIEQGQYTKPKKKEWYGYQVVKTAKCTSCGDLGYPLMWAKGPYEPLICKKCKENL